MVLFGACIVWAFTTITRSHCMQPLAYQYNTFLLEETNHYITKEFKKMAKDKAKKRAKEQIEAFLDVSETQQQQPKTSPQSASDQANAEQQDRSSSLHSSSSEHFEETDETKPLYKKSEEKSPLHQSN